MNTYYSTLGRLLDGRTPVRSDGYYILNEEDQVVFDRVKPQRVKVVTMEGFTQALVEGCRRVIRHFASDDDVNKGVYAFDLYADEHHSFYIYMNTTESFAKTLDSYQKKYADYKDEDRIHSLKYSIGDFEYQYWQEHMGEAGKYIDYFEKIAYSATDINKDEASEQASEAVIAFETGVIEDGYYVCALNAVRQLLAENAFDLLDRTDDFIAFASTGNDYLDYGLVMRKTIDQELFYRVFPEIRETDIQFEEAMGQNMHLPLTDAIAYWSDAIHSDYSLEPPFTYNKPAMDIFVQLERFGSELAEECFERLLEIANLDAFERKDFERIAFYIEALHFAGELTEEQMGKCQELADRLVAADEDLDDYARDLEALVCSGGDATVL